MEPNKMAKQMVTFQKSLFDNIFFTLSAMQDQTETMVNSFMTQFPWIPEEGRKAIGDAMGMYKKAFEDYQKAVDDGFKKMEEMFTAE